MFEIKEINLYRHISCSMLGEPKCSKLREAESGIIAKQYFTVRYELEIVDEGAARVSYHAEN